MFLKYNKLVDIRGIHLFFYSSNLNNCSDFRSKSLISCHAFAFHSWMCANHSQAQCGLVSRRQGALRFCFSRRVRAYFLQQALRVCCVGTDSDPNKVDSDSLACNVSYVNSSHAHSSASERSKSANGLCDLTSLGLVEIHKAASNAAEDTSVMKIPSFKAPQVVTGSKAED